MTLDEALLAADSCIELPDVVAAPRLDRPIVNSYLDWVFVLQRSPQEGWRTKPVSMNDRVTEQELVSWINKYWGRGNSLEDLRKESYFSKLDFRCYTFEELLEHNKAILERRQHDIR